MDISARVGIFQSTLFPMSASRSYFSIAKVRPRNTSLSAWTLAGMEKIAQIRAFHSAPSAVLLAA